MLLSRKPSLTENHGCTFEAVQFWKEVFPLVTGQGDTLHNGKKGTGSQAARAFRRKSLDRKGDQDVKYNPALNDPHSPADLNMPGGGQCTQTVSPPGTVIKSMSHKGHFTFKLQHSPFLALSLHGLHNFLINHFLVFSALDYVSLLFRYCRPFYTFHNSAAVGLELGHMSSLLSFLSLRSLNKS